ncbi:MAG: hypothetical protein HY208_07165 [Nitrospirae bacterium]|nr:hypothetical protein [Nitrospirota bacterium]
MRAESSTMSAGAPFLRALGLTAALGLSLPAFVCAAPPPPAGPAPGKDAKTEAPPDKPAPSSEPAAPAPSDKPLPAFPDLTGAFTSKSILRSVVQNFTGTLKRHGRKIYLEEESTSSGPVGYNEYFVYDLDKNMLYRLLRDEQIYFETPLSIEQRVEAIRKGWVPAEGPFTFGNVTVTLSSRDIPLRPDTIDKRNVELRLREITAEIPAIGTVPARTVRYYTFVWLDPALTLPVRISYGANNTHSIVEYRDIATQSVDASLFDIPKNYVNLTPY